MVAKVFGTLIIHFFPSLDSRTSQCLFRLLTVDLAHCVLVAFHRNLDVWLLINYARSFEEAREQRQYIINVRSGCIGPNKKKLTCGLS